METNQFRRCLSDDSHDNCPPSVVPMYQKHLPKYSSALEFILWRQTD